MAQEIRTEDIKVGETYRQRYLDIGRKVARRTVKVIAVHYDLMHKNVVTGVKVELAGGTVTTVKPGTFEAAE